MTLHRGKFFLAFFLFLARNGLEFLVSCKKSKSKKNGTHSLHIMEIIRKKLKIFKLVGYYRKKLKVSILVPYELKNILTRLGNLDDQGLMILSLPLWTSDVDQMLIRYSTI